MVKFDQYNELNKLFQIVRLINNVLQVLKVQNSDGDLILIKIYFFVDSYNCFCVEITQRIGE